MCCWWLLLPGLLGKLLVQNTTTIKQSNYRDESAQSTPCDPSRGSGREAFYPYCGLWFAQISPAISNACPFKIYCTIQTCSFYDSIDSNSFSPFNEN